MFILFICKDENENSVELNMQISQLQLDNISQMTLFIVTPNKFCFSHNNQSFRNPCKRLEQLLFEFMYELVKRSLFTRIGYKKCRMLQNFLKFCSKNLPILFQLRQVKKFNPQNKNKTENVMQEMKHWNKNLKLGGR